MAALRGSLNTTKNEDKIMCRITIEGDKGKGASRACSRIRRWFLYPMERGF